MYLLLLIPLGYSITIFIEYYFRDESPETRKRIPEAFIFAAIASFAIVFWIFFYVAVIYPYEKVYVSGQDRYEPDTAQPQTITNLPNDNRVKKGYSRTPKLNYIILHALFPAITGSLYIVAYIYSDKWVKRNEKN